MYGEYRTLVSHHAAVYCMYRLYSYYTSMIGRYIEAAACYFTDVSGIPLHAFSCRLQLDRNPRGITILNVHDVCIGQAEKSIWMGVLNSWCYPSPVVMSCIPVLFYFYLQPDKIEDKFTGLLEKKWTSVIRLQKKVLTTLYYSSIGRSPHHIYTVLFVIIFL